MPNRLDTVEQLHLKTLLNMIASSSFNAKMNSLKEVNRPLNVGFDPIRL